MATYLELDELLRVDEPTGLRRRVAIATMMAANAIRQEVDAGTAASRSRKRWAQTLLRATFDVSSAVNNQNQTAVALNPLFESVYRVVLTSNASFTKAQITGATDAAIQTAVNAAVDMLASNYPDPTV